MFPRSADAAFRDLPRLLEERHLVAEHASALNRTAASPPKIVLRQITLDLITEVIRCMRRNLEPLGSSMVAPSRYVIYLRAEEYARLTNAIPLLREQTIRALSDELDRLNQRSQLQRYVGWLRLKKRPTITSAERTWFVEFLPAIDGDLEERGLLIEAQLRMPPVVAPDFDRKVSLISTRRVTTRERIVPDTPSRPQS
ncbi:MAG TPA: hypothetical protein VKB50_10880 [Vicinamibacterales bacterium]|nr:hypothetical protein [Vicinamibacterales bacterium]